MPETVTTTPNDMPGAKTEGSPKMPTATEKEPGGGSTETTTANGGLDDAERAELERLRSVHKDEQKSRREATANHRDAEAYRNLAPALLKALGIEDAPKDFDAKSAIADLTSKFETAERERIRSEVARTEGVNPRYVVGSTEEEMRASAQEFKADLDAEVEKRAKAAKPTTSAAPAGEVTSNGKVTGPQQITSRDQLKNMTAKQIIEAREKGQLEDLMGGK